MNSTWHGKAVHSGCSTHYEVTNVEVYRYGDGTGRPLCHKDHMNRGIIDYGDPVIGWGYYGNGPRQLALTMLYYSCVISWMRKGFAGCISIACKYSDAFTEDVVSKWGDEWSITSDEVVKWIKEQEQKESND